MAKINPEDNLVGKQLGDYLLTRVLATGGMARIYEGVDQKLGRHAAVKVLDAEKIVTDETLTQRFQREARAVAKLEHQNIITIYQYGEYDGLYFLAMKLIKGKDLAHELSRLRRAGTTMEIGRGIRILEQVAAALDVAHEADIVHRDVKPSNILMDQNDHATLTDFGLVLQPSIDTTFGTAFGTPRYIAPEQALSSNKALPQSDIYSLAVIAYEILTGQTPFSGDSPMEIALAHINDTPPSLRSINPNVPEAAEREVLKALDKDPLKRHRTAGDFVSALKRAYPELEDQTAVQLLLTPAGPDPFLESWDDVIDLSSTSKSLSSRQSQSRKTLPTMLAVLVLVILVAIVSSVVVLTSQTEQSEATPSAEATPSTRPTAEPTEVQEVAVVPTDTPTPVPTESPTPAPTTAVPTATPTEAVTEAPTATEETVVLAAVADLPVTLSYTDTAFTIINNGDRDLDVSTLQFRRGSDEFSGEDIVRRVLPAGTCFRLQLQGRQSQLAEGCGRLHSETLLPDPSHFFWRTEPVNAEVFEIRYGGEIVATCPTVSRAGSDNCSFNLPAPLGA
ncbi:MAG TPA: serine/threonine-protein kinase [Oceanobacillus sp.]|nr:serine/threonine-protein kinase [Oceanobacillus sp.]